MSKHEFIFSLGSYGEPHLGGLGLLSFEIITVLVYSNCVRSSSRNCMFACHCRPADLCVTSASVFKIKENVFLDTLIQKIFF